MRRVDEAIREVLGDAIAKHLKDPRVGFVTVTDVETSPDLRHARVYVSVLGHATSSARRRSRASLRPRRPAALHRAASCAQAHADAALRARRDGSARGPAGGDHRADRRRARRAGAVGVSTATPEHAGDARRRCSGRFATASASCSSRTRTPTATRSARWSRCSGSSARSARTPSMFISAERLPAAATSTAASTSTGIISELPADVAERTIVFLDCGNIDRNPAEELRRHDATILNIDHHHDNTRFGTVNHVVEEASCTAEIVWDLMRGARRRADAGRSPRRSTSASSPTPAASCTRTPAPSAHVMAAELIAAGVDVARVYRRLYEGWPEAKLELLARALARAQHPRRRRALTLTQLSRDDFAEHGRRGQLHRGHHRPPARDRGHQGRGARARAAGDGSGRWKVSLRATDGDVDVSVIARRRRRRPPPRRASRPRCAATSSWRSCASRSSRSSDRVSERPAGTPDGAELDGFCSSTSPPARPRTT